MNATDTLWREVCALAEIPLRGARIASGVQGDIAIFRTANDDVFALRDRCPHKGGPLSQGMLHGETVTCPLHGWKLRLDSGEAVAPDKGCARRYPVKLENGRVFVAVD